MKPNESLSPWTDFLTDIHPGVDHRKIAELMRRSPGIDRIGNDIKISLNQPPPHSGKIFPEFS